jgi:hypothetical protein
VEELRPLTAHLVVKVLPTAVNARVDGSPSSYAEVLATPLGGMKSSCVEALASVLGRWLPMGGGACLTEVPRSLAMEFLAKMRAEVDRVIFFGLSLKIKASRDIRRRLVRALSRLGPKPKLLLGRRKLKRKACGFLLRPRPLETNSRVKPKAGDDKAAEPDLGQGETSSETASVVSAIELVLAKASKKAPVSVAPSSKSSPAKCLLRRGFLRPESSSSHLRSSSSSLGSSKSSSSGEVPSVSVEVVPEMDPDLEQVPGKVATCHPSSEKGMLWQGFLL